MIRQYSTLLFLSVTLISNRALAFVDFCGEWQGTIRSIVDQSPKMASKFKAAGIDPVALMCAIVDQESDGNPQAQRFEASFYNKHVKRTKTHVRREIREIRDQFHYSNKQAARAYSSAYGLTQLLYASARLEGYRYDPDTLKDPTINLFYASEHLFRKFRRAKKYHPKGDARELLLWTLRFWNGSPNSKETLAYALAVEKQYSMYRQILLAEKSVTNSEES